MYHDHSKSTVRFICHSSVYIGIIRTDALLASRTVDSSGIFIAFDSNRYDEDSGGGEDRLQLRGPSRTNEMRQVSILTKDDEDAKPGRPRREERKSGERKGKLS